MSISNNVFTRANCLIFTLLLVVFTPFQSNAQFTTSNLPIVIIDTESAVEITKDRIVADMKIVDNADSVNSVDGPFNDYDGLISIKGRGSSSWENYEKKGYTLETQLSTGENNNVSLLGLPEENDWVLHGPYADKTLMKNAFVYDVGSALGRYTPRTHFCELVLNGEYRGVYLLVERIKRDKNRLDISKLNPDENSGDDLTGGYIMRIDRLQDDLYSWPADFGFGLSYYNYYYPDPEDMSQTQRDYIRDYLNDFQNALANRPLLDEETGYRAYANVPSFIDYFIISELTKNLDAYRLSTYMYKDKDSEGGKLTMGPIWDFNLSCGGVNIGFGDWPAQPENWVFQELPDGVPFWWEKLLTDEYYNSCLKERWSELRQEIISESSFNTIIDDYAALLDEAKDRNFEIFPLEEAVWGNNHFGLTYAEEVQMLKDFMADRISWMDQAIDDLPGNLGCTECFENCQDVVITGNSTLNSEIRLYPNPVVDRLNIQSNHELSFGSILVIKDLTGRVVLERNIEKKPGTSHTSVDVSFLGANEIYIYRIISGAQILDVGKFIKQ